ncbi:hypothetical protein PENTCL1PPCAC_22095, partial [Pristionchus entomophagus]
SRQPRHPLSIRHRSIQPLNDSSVTSFVLLLESLIGSDRELSGFHSIVDSDESSEVVRLVDEFASLHPSNIDDHLAKGARELP